MPRRLAALGLAMALVGATAPLHLLLAGEAAPRGAMAERMLARVNEVRTAAGLQPVKADETLMKMAQALADDLAQRETLSHRDSNGNGLEPRLARFGYVVGLAVENVAAGRPSPEETVADWMSSPGHRANLLRPEVQDAGVGYVFKADDRPGIVGYRWYWALDMGRRLGP